MKQKKQLIGCMCLFLSFSGVQSLPASDRKVNEIAPGVSCVSIGTPDKFTPYSLFANAPKTATMAALPQGTLPFDLNEIIVQKNERGCTVYIPLNDEEQLYGFGMQMGSFMQRGLKKKPIVNDFPLTNLGYTHAPQPFYVSTSGYGILINTAKYTTFYCGTENELKDKVSIPNTLNNSTISTSTEELYKAKKSGKYVFVDIPGTEGIEVFVLSGPSIKNAVERYNLLSGGGCLPPMWGLGIKYRTKTDFNQKQVLDIADYFRKKNLPCDVLGLEPGWQTASYSCSYVWSEKRFPDHAQLTKELYQKGFRVNLWEHAYVHPSSPIHKDLKDFSGNFLVWNGLVPDFILPEARQIFGNHHQKLIDGGIHSFKLDECDNSNIASGNSNWGFPEMSIFPSGIDGERMHQLYGSLYVRMMDNLFRQNNVRSYQDYRSSGLFMSSVPATLYSDTYNHKEYIQMICNAAFGGLLWSPELRESASKEELFQRMQLVLLSPQAVLNSWYLQMPPWWQPDKEKNNKAEMLPDVLDMEEKVRNILNQRMSLLPYLYSAFYNYHLQGTPPFRPLVMDYVEDKKVWSIDDQYLIGESLMAIPFYNGENHRKAYFPKGDWYDFHTGEKYEGGQTHTVESKQDRLPLFVKGGSILPLARPVPYVTPTTTFDITCQVYGTENIKSFTLFEDDGISYNYEKGIYNLLTLSAKNKKGKMRRVGNNAQKYTITQWKYIQ